MALGKIKGKRTIEPNNRQICKSESFYLFKRSEKRLMKISTYQL